MNKNIILLGALIISGVAYSQVGIDTDTPKATLDIKATPTSTTKIDGLIAPRLKGSELKTNDPKYTSDQDGAIVYVTEALASANTSTKTANVTSIGYYYFDKTLDSGSGQWVKVRNGYDPSGTEPWYNQADGTQATSNTQNIYQLGKVGINTNSPSNNLHVKGTSPGNDEVIVKVEDNNMSSGHKVLIKLGKNDSGKKDAADIKYYYDADDSNSNRIDFGFSGNSESMSLTSQGNFGIGTSAPTQKLDVNGATRLRGQIYDNNNVSGANGQVLSTNSSGQVVWQNNIAITPIAIGVMNNTAPSYAVNSANYNTGSYIELPQGKWVVNATMLLRKTGGLLPSDAALWIRAGFSTSTTSYISAGNILSGSLVGPSNFGLMNGIVVINNASGSTQKYYLWRLTSEHYGSATGAEVLDNFAGAWGENQIVATPVN